MQLSLDFPKKEFWVDIIGYDGLYKISNTGRIYATNTKKYMKLNQRGDYYWTVRLSIKDVSTKHYVHRLVAIHFINNPSNYPVVNHIDGNKSNFSLENLEWCTHRHNALHYIDGFVNKKSTYFDRVSYVKKHIKNLKMTEIAKNLNCTLTNVYKICYKENIKRKVFYKKRN